MAHLPAVRQSQRQQDPRTLVTQRGGACWKQNFSAVFIKKSILRISMGTLQKFLSVQVFEDTESSGIDEAGWGMNNKQWTRGPQREVL